MPCYDYRSDNSVTVDYISIFLCKSCKFLSKEIMKSIKYYGNEYCPHENLFEWYKSHLYFDYKYKYNDSIDKKIVEKEFERLGLIFINDSIIENT